MRKQQIYHRGRNGSPMPCKAEPGKCPLGGHGNLSFTQNYCDKINEAICISEEELIKKSIANNEEADIFRTALYERLSKNKQRKKLSLDEFEFKDYAEEDSGISLNVNTNEIQDSGFCISPYPERSQGLNKTLSNKEFREYLKNYCDKNNDLLSQDNHCLGLWRDDVGTLWIDVSVIKSDASDCRKLGSEKDQIAYFDLQTNSSITIDNSSLSGQSITEILKTSDNEEENKKNIERAKKYFKKQADKGKGTFTNNKFTYNKPKKMRLNKENSYEYQVNAVIFTEHGPMYEANIEGTAKAYSEELEKCYNYGVEGKAVTRKTADELIEDTKYMLVSPDGHSGALVTEDGEIGGVFSNAAQYDSLSSKGLVKKTFPTLIENGGYWLECYNTYLPKTYAKQGFKVNAYLDINEEYVPAEYKTKEFRDRNPAFTKGVVFMSLEDKSIERFKEWEDAESYTKGDR